MFRNKSGIQRDQKIKLLVAQVERAGVVAVDESDVGVGRAVVVDHDLGQTVGVVKELGRSFVNVEVRHRVEDKGGSDVDIAAWVEHASDVQSCSDCGKESPTIPLMLVVFSPKLSSFRSHGAVPLPKTTAYDPVVMRPWIQLRSDQRNSTSPER